MEIKIDEYEKLGAFYLGREYDLATKQAGESLVLYDSKDLVTHGVVLGMTGSGKTGLCLSIIEEAAMDNIPSIIIDPKGDLSNLLLTFPELRPEDFRPWINEEDAHKKAQSPDEYAASQAAAWEKGLSEWGITRDRIRQLREKVEMTIYTPGSNAGLPVSILSSFEAPPSEILEDDELLGERIESTVSSLLALVGIDADPLQSREHILLSNVISTRWHKGENLTLALLIEDIQAPPFAQVGVVDLEAFFPEKKRTELAMAVNSLLAAPSFQTWLTGVPLDLKSMLHTPEGKPCLGIFSIAHLTDSERMFFVSLLLNECIAWMRRQSGTTSLRALLYMDEIFGYLPPTANPPSKKPMLVLLKQGRAFGFGVLLATQNPVDLDYKALANMGTWWLGRLQTERDKARVLDGLEGASAAQQHGFDRGQIDRMLSGLGNRIFLMNNAHEDHPVLFQVRWCMSYLRGPLVRNQIKSLMDPLRKRLIPSSGSKPSAVISLAGSVLAVPEIAPINGDAAADNAPLTAAKPTLAKGIPELFLPATSANPNRFPIVCLPHLLRAAEILFSDAKKGLSGKKKVTLLDPLRPKQSTFSFSETTRLETRGTEAFSAEPDPATAQFQPLPPFAMQAKPYAAAKSEFIGYCSVHEGVVVLCAEPFDSWSQIGETEGQFRVRLGQELREARDAAIDDLRQKFAKKAMPLEERLRRAEAAVQREKDQEKGAWMQTAMSVGTGVLGALLGRKTISATTVSRGATAARQAGRAWSQKGDVTRAEDTVGAVRAMLDALEAECSGEIAAMSTRFDAATIPLETYNLVPFKKNILVTAVGVAWIPFFRVSESSLEPAWE